MQDQYPIDALFREALHGVTSAPPAGLWNKLIMERERRRRAAAWRIRRGLGVAILTIFIFGTGAYWAWHGSTHSTSLNATTGVIGEGIQPDGETPIGIDHPARTSGNADGQVGELFAQKQENIQGATGVVIERNETKNDRRDHASPSTAQYPADPRLEAGPGPGTCGSSGSGVSLVGNARKDLRGTTNDPGEPLVQKPTPASAGAEVEFEVKFVRPRPIPFANMVPTNVPRTAAEVHYVLPSGAWWFAAQVGLFNVQRHWGGTPDRLTDALNGSEAWHSTIALGGMVGRTWRSGFGVGIGLDVERSEQAFHHLDRQERTENIIHTHLVTLNTQVFVSSVDTTTVSVVDERWIDGLDRRQVVRATAEAFWHTGIRRWQFGPHAGVGLEFTHARSAGTLAFNEIEGRLERAALSAGTMNARYPVMVMGMAGLDVDYSIDEHWSVGATPMAMFSIGPIGDHASTYCSPTRLGSRFRITRTLSR